MNQFRPDIEGLRAVAILLVVAYHAQVPGFTGGYVGVDVFFVLSGYLITSLLVNELERTGTIGFTNFYARRARRLLPAVAGVLLFTAIVGTILYAPVEQDRLANTSLATSAYASNLYFARAATNYLAAPSHTNPLLHTWSLSVEEQFYVIWPVAVLLLAGAFGRGQLRYRRLFVGMVLLATASFASAVYLTRTTQPWAFFLSPPRAWEFALGGLAILTTGGTSLGQRFLGRRASVAPAWLDHVLGWVGLAGIVSAGILFGEQTVFPGTSALLPTIATVLVLRTGARTPDRGVSRLLGTRFFREIGRLSYSWYLWHWPLLVFAATISDSLTVPARVVIVILALGVAQISYRWVEQPTRHNRTLTLRPRYALAMAALIAVSGVSSAVVWKYLSAGWAERPDQSRFTRMKIDFPEIYRMDCDDYFHSAAVKECRFGATDAKRTAVLFGDSHAGHWFPAVRRIFAEQSDWRLIVITKSACPIVEASYFSRDLGRVYTQCSEWLQNSLKRIHEMRPDLVLVSYAKLYPFSPNEWRTGMASAIRSLSEASASVILLRDVPALGFDGPSCLARLDWRPAFLRRWSTCRSDLGSDSADAIFAFQQQASAAYPNVVTLDMNENVCPSRTCRVVQNGIVSYRDETHLSTAFATSLSGKLAEAMSSALKKVTNGPVLAVRSLP